ncbi:MAG: hypothetical protein WD424_02775 [Paenibacillaceae bacterium]
MELRQMVETITKEILQAMPNLPLNATTPAKKVLFVFCDSQAHEAYLDTFIELQRADIKHDALFLDGATAGWIGISRIESGGADQVIAMDENAPSPIEIPLLYDAVIIPEIDLDHAARIAMGLKGTIKSEIVCSALILNKPVIVGSECSGIKRADRRTLSVLELPDPYRRRFEKFMEELKELGIIVQQRESLVKPLIQMWHKSDKLTNALAGKAAASSNGLEAAVFEGRLLTEQWVKTVLSEGKILRVSKRTIITPLARDALRQRAIVIEIMK